MEAKFAGWCKNCGQTIEVGDSITAEGTHWVHTRCEERDTPYVRIHSAFAPKTKTEVCDTCHMTKPCFCEESK